MKKLFKKRKLEKVEKRMLIVMVFSLIVLGGMIAIHLPPPVWIRMGPGSYISVGESEWIACGDAEEPLTEGRYFKITHSSWLEGEPACKYEVDPAGFPIGCCFIDEEGIYGFNIIDFIIDFFALSILFLLVSYYAIGNQNLKYAKDKKMKKKTIAFLFCFMLVICLVPLNVHAENNATIVTFYASPAEIIKGDNLDLYFKLSGSGSVEYTYSRIDANGKEQFLHCGRGLIREIDPNRLYKSDIWWEFLIDGWAGKHQSEIFLKIYDTDNPDNLLAQASTIAIVDASPPNPPEPPVIEYFYFNPDTILQGQVTYVEWKASNTLYCWIDPSPGIYSPVFGVGIEGKKQFRPSESSTYRLIAFGKGGETDAYASLTVKKSPDSEKISPSPLPPDPPSDPVDNFPPLGPLDADPFDTVDETQGEYEFEGDDQSGAGDSADTGNLNYQDYIEEGFGLYSLIVIIAAIAVFAFVGHLIDNKKLPKFRKKQGRAVKANKK